MVTASFAFCALVVNLILYCLGICHMGGRHKQPVLMLKLMHCLPSLPVFSLVLVSHLSSVNIWLARISLSWPVKAVVLLRALAGVSM
jgi:hypothetical protein